MYLKELCTSYLIFLRYDNYKDSFIKYLVRNFVKYQIQENDI